MAKQKANRNDKIELYSYVHNKTKKKLFRVRVVASNGKVICSTGDGYINHKDALAVAIKLENGFAPAQIVDLSKKK